MTGLGIDVGGTTVSMVLLEPDGRVTAAREERMPVGLPAPAALKCVAATARVLAAGAGFEPRDLAGIGLAMPGTVDGERGVLRRAPNVPWRDVPVAALVADALEAPVVVEHDVRMAALGEARLGAGRGVASFACVTVGTGIGAAVVLDGRLYRGASDAAGEIGHVPLAHHHDLCGCGRRGCLETVASGRAIADRVRRADGRLLTARAVFAAAAAGDPTCARVVDEAIAALGRGLTILVNVLNPEVIAVGGGVAEAGAALLDRLRASIRAAAWGPAAEVVRVVPAALGTRAGAIGAAVFAAERTSRC